MIASRFLTGYAGHIRAAYRPDHEHYFAWCVDHGVPVLDAGRSTVYAYARHLAEQPPSQAAAERRYRGAAPGHAPAFWLRRL